MNKIEELERDMQAERVISIITDARRLDSHRNAAYFIWTVIGVALLVVWQL